MAGARGGAGRRRGASGADPPAVAPLSLPPLSPATPPP
eukprot:CAMPEP_0196682230 /NCGR_PEP_ID=MMETSP1090-20130531/9083_1 /TAXON_ID=37098 /ORGANISM="Isochrysis sp, Strain CCMP1244" /LENGTH=37 /DNA_ID= /DNA_START= /DNA_END= /DNA_ORIENTATION=